MNSTQIAKMIDHTILKATTTKEDVVKICKEAKEYGFFSVCINPANIELAKEELKGSNVKVCTVIGFPLGANTSAVKAFETKDAIAKGADEVDMVINTPTKGNDATRDGFRIRRLATEYSIDVMTSLDTLKALVKVNQKHINKDQLKVYNLAE